MYSLQKKISSRFNKLRMNLAHWIEPNNRRPSAHHRHTLREWLIYHQQEMMTLEQVSWMGVSTLKNVLDLWIYQEIFWEVKPDIVIEIGSFKGGSTLYLAHLLDIIGKGQVISIDINRAYYQVAHNRIILLTGDSQAEEIIAEATKLTWDKSVLVIHDANHESAHVLKDLEIYASLVTIGSYLIVEDGIVDIMGAEFAWFEPDGPLAAIETFLERTSQFEIDTTRERYWLTYNPKGYLKRIS